MTSRIKSILYIFCLSCFIACGAQEAGEWLIPSDQVFDGGPGKDGIPSIDQPNFSSVDEALFMSDDDLILALYIDGEIKAYPHRILDWHEIVNDGIGNTVYAVTYCPLTGTGIAWNRKLNNNISSFGVSGLLYNSNLMPYDRQTNSTWSQQRLDCVNGEMIGEKAESYSMFETKWATLKNIFPDAQILNTLTGFSRNYQNYPYGDYRSNHDRILFPVNQEDNRLPRKERVLGVIIQDQAKAYPFDMEYEASSLILDQHAGKELIVVRNTPNLFIQAFIHPQDLNFELVEDALPVILQDQKGNSYDIFGVVVDGPDIGSRLELPTQFMGFWFSWAAFYPGLDLS